MTFCLGITLFFLLEKDSDLNLIVVLFPFQCVIIKYKQCLFCPTLLDYKTCTRTLLLFHQNGSKGLTKSKSSFDRKRNYEQFCLIAVMHILVMLPTYVPPLSWKAPTTSSWLPIYTVDSHRSSDIMSKCSISLTKKQHGLSSLWFYDHVNLDRCKNIHPFIYLFIYFNWSMMEKERLSNSTLAIDEGVNDHEANVAFEGISSYRLHRVQMRRGMWTMSNKAA